MDRSPSDESLGFIRSVPYGTAGLAGDMNCDSAVALGDVGGFTGVLLAPEQASDCEKYLADINGKGRKGVGSR